jgi:hypothetical protein
MSMTAISMDRMRSPWHMSQSLRRLCTGFLIVLITGCGSHDGGPHRVPVAGTVRLDGKPLQGAEVSLYADGEARLSVTDEDGYFQIPGGAQALKYKVVISKFDGTGQVPLDAAAGMDSGQIQAMQMADGTGKTAAKIAKQVVPDRYSSREKSELTLDVPLDGTQSADFELVRK